MDTTSTPRSVTFGTMGRPRKKPVTGEKRDTQRSKVYEAEDKAHYLTYGRSLHTRTLDNDQVQARIDEIMAMRAIQSRWGQHKIRVRFTHGGGHASSPWEIALGASSRNDWFILHEIAHCLTWGVGASHGKEYAGVYLFLVKTVLGETAYKNLLAQFRERRVTRTNSAIPAPTRPVVTKAVKAAKRREADTRPVHAREAREAASVIRRAVRNGLYGPSGCKPRAHALATARMLEA